MEKRLRVFGTNSFVVDFVFMVIEISSESAVTLIVFRMLYIPLGE